MRDCLHLHHACEARSGYRLDELPLNWGAPGESPRNL